MSWSPLLAPSGGKESHSHRHHLPTGAVLLALMLLRCVPFSSLVMCLRWIHSVYPAWSSLSFLNLQACVSTKRGKFSAISLQICFRHGPSPLLLGLQHYPLVSVLQAPAGWRGPRPHARRVDWMVPGEQVALWTLTDLPFPIKLVHVFPLLDLK